ncbi:MAG: hypothetical protein BWY93_02030 [Euryarchaeota archaeon ADurb.BinA087]|nr:MAG: hypothetical protein BWY93_02030 [Euryarchaeota archaeon ADurb.BinA087]
MTNKKICPFCMARDIMHGGNTRCCIEERCMAWQPEITREVPIMKWGEHGEVLKKDKTFPAHCKLIERG